MLPVIHSSTAGSGKYELPSIAAAAIEGSSYFRLPAVLEWITGSIGLHHVHHLGPRIPNYNLRRCHAENPMFHRATVVTLRQSFSALRLALWDEDTGRLVRFDRAAEVQHDAREGNRVSFK